MTFTGIVFAGLFLAALLLSLTRNAAYGMYAYIAVFYLHPPSRWWGASLPDLRWAFLAAGVTLLSIWISRAREPGRPPWFRTAPGIIMVLFIAWFWLGSQWAIDPEQHMPQAYLVTKYLLVFYFVHAIVDTPRKSLWFIFAHLLGCGYLGYLGYTAPVAGRLDGVGGPGIDDSNTLGMHLATGVVSGAMLVLYFKGWKKLLCVIPIGLAMNAIILAGSRGAFLALVAGGLALAVLRPVQYRRSFLIYAASAVVLLGMVASAQFWERMGTVKAISSDNPEELDLSAQSRLVMMDAQFKMAVEHPLGAGHRGSEALSANYLDPIFLTAGGARSSHNSALTVLVEQGIPGMLLFVAIALWSLRVMLKLRRETNAGSLDIEAGIANAGVGAALTVILVAGIFADFSKCEVQIWMFALLASLQSMQGRKSGELRNPEPAEPPRRSTPLRTAAGSGGTRAG